MSRELTREEKAAIRRLVLQCANYDREYSCLPLDCDCYMLGKCWTGAYCRYFREAVLPTDPVLEAALTGGGRSPRLVQSAAGLFCRTAECAIARRPVPTPPTGNNSGRICGKSGADLLTISTL